jgi:Leucine-rich repeat (LRR) protein
MNVQAISDTAGNAGGNGPDVRTNRTVSPKLWIPAACVLVAVLAVALYGSSFFQSLFLSGQLKSLGVDITKLPAGGIKVAARQTAITNQHLQQISQMPEVVHLDLYGCEELSSDGFAHLGAMETLRKLNLSGTRIKTLAPLAACSHLEALALDRSDIEDPSLAALRDMTSLRLFSANGTALNDSSLESLGPVPGLRSLYLANTQVSGKILDLLDGYPHLQTLNLSGSQLTDDDLAHEKWPEIPSLRQLFLNDLAITDTGLKTLSTTIQEKLTGLTSIGLSNTKITAASLDELAQLPQLETIRLNGTPIPREDIERLRLEMPETYIEGN